MYGTQSKTEIELNKRYRDDFLEVKKLVVNRDILDFKSGVFFIPAFLL